MYGRGNYAASVGQGPYTSAPPFNQRPLAPQPPFSQSPHPPLPTVIQQGPPPVPPQVGQLGLPVYQHAPPEPPQQGPPNPGLSGGTNAQPYLTPAPPPPPPPPPRPLRAHGSSQMQQQLQWTHNSPFIPPAGPPLAHRVLPPPPSLGQTLFSSQVHQPSAGSMQAKAQPSPPVSSFYASSPFGSFEHTVPQVSNAAPVRLTPPPPPPLPSSPSGSPPLPPCSPPPTSLSLFSKIRMSVPIPTASESASHPEIGSRVTKSSALDRSPSASLGGVSAPYLIGDALRDGEAGFKTVSVQVENLISDLPPPPPKPSDDRTVHSIEVLCRFIAKNGPEFENMTRQKEFGNPEFKFLFGGGPGTQAAVAHQYFVWTKKKKSFWTIRRLFIPTQYY